MLKSMREIIQLDEKTLYPWDQAIFASSEHCREFQASSPTNCGYTKHRRYYFAEDTHRHCQWRRQQWVDDYAIEESVLDHTKFAEDCRGLLNYIAEKVWLDKSTDEYKDDLGKAVVALARITNAYFCDVEQKPNAGMPVPGKKMNQVVYSAGERRRLSAKALAAPSSTEGGQR